MTGAKGLGEGGAYAHMNHLDPHLRSALAFIGINDLRSVAVEGEEFGGDTLAASVAAAHAGVDALVDTLLAEVHATPRVQEAATA